MDLCHCALDFCQITALSELDAYLTHQVNE
jgi:hypothetical protein